MKFSNLVRMKRCQAANQEISLVVENVNRDHHSSVLVQIDLKQGRRKQGCPNPNVQYKGPKMPFQNG